MPEMRRPTPEHEAYAWHAAAIAGERPATVEGDPQCGWFKTRAIKDGPWIPASITLEQHIDPETGELVDDETFACEVGGERRDAARAFTSLRPIPEDEYRTLVSLRAQRPELLATHVPYRSFMRP